MFQTAELGQSVDKQAYKAQVPPLRTRLLELQNELKTAGVSVVIVIGGVDGGGKSETVNVLHEWFDPRFLGTHAFGRMTDEERMRPPFWRFWLTLPPAGKVGIFFGSWYTEPIIARAYGETTDADLTASMDRVNAFERGLVNDGTLVLKFWFHLSKVDQAKRLKKLNKDPEDNWRVTERDWAHFKRYDTFRTVCERALSLTQTGEAPWTLIEATDHRFRNLAVGRHIERELSRVLKEREKQRAIEESAKQAALIANAEAVRLKDTINPAGTGPMKTILSTVDLTRTVEPERYKNDLKTLQARFARLCREFHHHDLSAIFAFEGWDAAGKGGVIRRMSSAMDARHYTLIPIAAPTDEELAHHYMWRFWRHLPRPGRVTIFDRSWYGRVLVERVEGFAEKVEWSRAYAEINEFERQLVEHGVVVNKFWLHIDADEQLRRFKEREATPYKQFKITQEDWRNRSRWDAYELAVHDMVERTSTAEAPWTLVPSNSKKYARLFTLETVCERMEARLAAVDPKVRKAARAKNKVDDKLTRLADKAIDKARSKEKSKKKQR